MLSGLTFTFLSICLNLIQSCLVKYWQTFDIKRDLLTRIYPFLLIKAPQNGVSTLCFEQNKVHYISKRTKKILKKLEKKLRYS